MDSVESRCGGKQQVSAVLEVNPRAKTGDYRLMRLNNRTLFSRIMHSLGIPTSWTAAEPVPSTCTWAVACGPRA